MQENKKSIRSIVKRLRRYKRKGKEQKTSNQVFKKCPACERLISKDKVQEEASTCPDCGYHFNIEVKARMEELLDKYKIINKPFKFSNPIDFPGYKEKYKSTKKKSGSTEAILSVEGKIDRIKLVVVALNNRFLMGSMGSYVGEEVAKAFEYAGKRDLPILIFSTSGGARMQEGIFSLMQMAKTSIAVEKFGETGNLYISCMTDPTTGGVTASFASLGDIIIAEPGALIGFAGPRVIKETIKGELPEGFQRSEFLKGKGFLDDIVHRKQLKKYIYNLLKLHGYGS